MLIITNIIRGGSIYIMQCLHVVQLCATRLARATSFSIDQSLQRVWELVIGFIPKQISAMCSASGQKRMAAISLTDVTSPCTKLCMQCLHTIQDDSDKQIEKRLLPANFMASWYDMPSRMPTTTAPVKQSPAPVVSTTCTNHHPVACLQGILMACSATFVTVSAIPGQASDACAEQCKML